MIKAFYRQEENGLTRPSKLSGSLAFRLFMVWFSR